MNRATQLKGISALASATLLLVAISFFLNRSLPLTFGAILLLTGLQSILAFMGLVWALPRPGHTFYSIFVGDALLRLAGLGLATYWLLSRHIPYTGPLVILGAAYLLFSVVQIPFFYYRAR